MKNNTYFGNGNYRLNKEITKKIRKETIDKTESDKLNEWYSTYYDAEFFIECTGTKYLSDFYNKKFNIYGTRFNNWFNSHNLENNIHLDIGFSTGKTLYWLSKKYPNIVIDTFDFNENCKNIFEPLKELIPQIRNIDILDATNLNYEENSYDSITALDFYEHVPIELMIESLKINYKILKPNGEMFIYLGKSPNEEHINILPDSTTIQLCKDIGFQLKNSFNELLTFTKHD